jgi:uncharacterized protein YecA (UPF0149 family)
MASEAQLAANRRNALLSTGPRSSDGKRASSLNAVRHGAYSSLHSLTPAETADFDLVFQHHFRTWNSPADDEAHRLLREIALADYRRERTRGVIFSTMNVARLETRADFELQHGPHAGLDAHDAYLLRHDTETRNALQRLQKLENSYTRQMDKSLRELKQRLAQLDQSAAQPPQPVATTSPDVPLPATAHLDETNPISSRNRPCPCGSGAKYKHCCGKAHAVGSRPADQAA